VFEGEQSDVACNQYAYYDRGTVHEFQRRSVTFYTSKHWHRHPTDLAGLASAEDPAPFAPVPVPDDAQLGTFGEVMLLELRTEWAPPGAGRAFPAGSLLACPFGAAMAGDWSQATCLFEPKASVSLQAQAATKNFLVLKVNQQAFEAPPGRVDRRFGRSGVRCSYCGGAPSLLRNPFFTCVTCDVAPLRHLLCAGARFSMM